MVAPQRNIPTILAAFGATGDLMRIKVVPALLHLYLKNELPDMFKVIGFSRRPWGDAEFRNHVKETIATHVPKGVPAARIESFLKMFYFQQGDFDEKESYEALKETFSRLDSDWGVCANKLFYLAVAPEFYETIFRHLSKSGLTDPCSPEEGWTRIVVEKPFGNDLKTAKRLDLMLGKLFKEEQIYRIDHYLAKEMLQNIINFRFSNNLFEPSWGREMVESVHLRLLERIGVEKRGSYYDGAGALRDVGQNHLLQMLALVAMERPKRFTPDAIRAERVKILKKLKLISKGEMKHATFRAQYEGYRKIPGVAPDSNVETYFKIVSTLATPRWKGVPFYLESGKRLGEPLKEIVVRFKHPSPCLCPPGGPHHHNEVIIRMEPKEQILIEFWSKKPGLTLATEPRQFEFLLREREIVAQYTEEYEKLLLDCIRGDQTLFTSTEEVQAMWRYIDPIETAWKSGGKSIPLHPYAPDTKDILKESVAVEKASKK